MFLKKYKNKKAAGERGCCCKSPGPVSGGCFGCGASPPKYTKQRGNPATELKVSKKAASKDEGPQTKSRKSTRIANRAARVLTK